MSVLDSQEIVPAASSYEAPQFEVLGQLAELATGLNGDGSLTMQASFPIEP